MFSPSRNVRKAGRKISLSCFLLHAAISPHEVFSDSIQTVDHVIHISVDGLVPSAIQDNGLTPNFGRLRTEGAGTDNARADYTCTQTLPSHISQLTGLPVEEHGWDVDGYDGGVLTPYRQNIVDLVSKSPRNGKACFYAAKEKFDLFRESFEMEVYVNNKNGNYLTRKLIDEMMSDDPCEYAFMHLREPDNAGHRGDGTDKGYHAAVGLVDSYLGAILDAIEDTSHLAGKTAIILTTDHGFATTRHADVALIGNYQIPFYVWGPGVKRGGDLYKLNPKTRADPGKGRPNNYEIPQPIRHLDAGVMAADFLGIEPKNGRFSRQDVAVGRSPAASLGEQESLAESDKQESPAKSDRQESPSSPDAPPEEESSNVLDSNQLFCGQSWSSAKETCATATPCPGRSDAECPSGQRCYADISCGTPVQSVRAVAPSSAGGDISNTSNFCGKNWEAAERKCNRGKAVHCPGGLNTECPSGESCFAGMSCLAVSGGIRKLNLRGS